VRHSDERSHEPGPGVDPRSEIDRYDIEFYWDPICPFAWITSRWIVKVAAQRDYRVDWRFIGLRFLNEHRDYAEFPASYMSLHTQGQRMLRVAAAVRAATGRSTMGALYTAYGESIWHRKRVAGVDSFEGIADAAHLRTSLQQAGLDPSFADAADDAQYDDELREEVATALSRTGPGVGTPVVVFQPPDGMAFFGPVISRIPDDADALRLWDAVLTLGSWPGFAEIKRTMREMPQLPLLER
jgi:2-hydroxychromene-2-carboxylate isomerase